MFCIRGILFVLTKSAYQTLHESPYQQKNNKQQKHLPNSKHVRAVKLSRRNTVMNSNLHGNWNFRNRIKSTKHVEDVSAFLFFKLTDAAAWTTQTVIICSEHNNIFFPQYKVQGCHVESTQLIVIIEGTYTFGLSTTPSPPRLSKTRTFIIKS